MTPFNHRPPGGYLFGIEMSAIMPSLIGGLASSVIAGALTDKDAPAPSPAPEVEPVTPMPSVNDQERRAAQRRSIAEQRRRQGRASTILTDTEDRLGG